MGFAQQDCRLTLSTAWAALHLHSAFVSFRYITQQGHKLEVGAPRPPATVTNAVSWRSEGIKYRKNEVFMDVIESVNLLVSQYHDNIIFHTGNAVVSSQQYYYIYVMCISFFALICLISSTVNKVAESKRKHTILTFISLLALSLFIHYYPFLESIV